MTTYETILANAVKFIKKNGRTKETIDKLRGQLPTSWASEIINDALNITA